MATKKSSSAAANPLTHLNPQGEVHMVDVGGKQATRRVAVAEARVLMGAKARRLAFPSAVAKDEASKKGDVLATARIAGIMAAKKTSELIPLCHPLALSHVAIDIVSRRYGAQITVTAETTGPTGVEMEAITAASVAALTLYDMLKAVERGITIETVRLLEKKGGKSGHWRR